MIARRPQNPEEAAASVDVAIADLRGLPEWALKSAVGVYRRGNRRRKISSDLGRDQACRDQADPRSGGRTRQDRQDTARAGGAAGQARRCREARRDSGSRASGGQRCGRFG